MGYFCLVYFKVEVHSLSHWYHCCPQRILNIRILCGCGISASLHRHVFLVAVDDKTPLNNSEEKEEPEMAPRHQSSSDDQGTAPLSTNAPDTSSSSSPSPPSSPSHQTPVLDLTFSTNGARSEYLAPDVLPMDHTLPQLLVRNPMNKTRNWANIYHVT